MKKLTIILDNLDGSLNPHSLSNYHHFKVHFPDWEISALLTDFTGITSETLKNGGILKTYFSQEPIPRGLILNQLEFLSEFLEENPQDVVVSTHNNLNRDLLARCSIRKKGAFIGDVTGITPDSEKGPIILRPFFGGKIWAKMVPRIFPLFMTIRANAFPQPTINAVGGETLPLKSPEIDPHRQELVEWRVDAGSKIDLNSASIIVSAGRGAKPESSIELVHSLAHLLKGGIGASRAIVDEGLRPHSEQIGQTGKVVNPNLYIACGISGAIQHQVGMRTSKCIVAINKDPQAPIFKIATFGVVADLNEFIPLFIEQISKTQL